MSSTMRRGLSMFTVAHFLCLFLVWAAATPVDALTILSPARLAGTRVNTPRILPRVYGFAPVQGYMVDSTLNGTCADLMGRIVLLDNDTTDANPLQKSALQLQRCGAIALVLWDNFSEYAGSATAFRTEESKEVRIPMLSVGCENEINYWELWSDNGVGYVIQATMVLFCGAIAGMGGAKLLAFIKHRGFSFRSVPQAVLMLRIFTNTFRLVYYAIDPLFLGRVFRNSQALALFNVTTPFDIVATLVIAFYWHEILRRKNAFRLDFINNMTIPVAVISIILIVMELTLVFLRLFLDSVPVASYITGGTYITASISIGVYFLVVGISLVLFLRKGTRASSDERSLRILRRTTIAVVALSVCNLLLAASILVTAFQVFLADPFVFRSVLLMQSISLALCGLVSVLSIHAPFSEDSSDVNGHELKHKSPSESQSAMSGVETVPSSQHVRFHTTKSSTASSSALSAVDTVVINSEDAD